MFLSFWKLGKRRAVVVFWGLDLGREEAVRRMFVKGSNATPPLPMIPLIPLTKSPVSPSSCAILLAQSSFPVQITTCSAYAAIVFNSGDLRSISRSGGIAAHSQVGEGHVCVYGIVTCRREAILENFRTVCVVGARGRRVRNMACAEIQTIGRRAGGRLYVGSERGSARMTAFVVGDDGARSSDLVSLSLNPTTRAFSFPSYRSNSIRNCRSGKF